MLEETDMKPFQRTRNIVVATTLALATVACASAPDRPTQQLARAETGVEFAEENGAGEFGAAALERARDHLAEAQRAADDGDYEIALQAAEKAELDAELAAAQTNRYKAEEALAEIRRSIDVLRNEIERHRAS
jgi:septal ring factor EnvC (AmiA/AmiB activator)